MRKKQWWLWLILAGVLTFFCRAQVVSAAEGTDFALQAELPANQIKDSGTYFNLLVRPGEVQDLTVYVTNLSDADKKVRVTPTNAKTFNNGQIGYTPNEDRDKSAKYQFTDLTSQAVTVPLKPKQTVPVTFKTQIPKEGFDGQILGGIYATNNETTQSKQSGTRIVNRYAYSIAVKLQTNTNLVAPELNLNTVRPGIQNNRMVVLANVRNVTPRLFGKISYDSKVTKRNSAKVVMKRTVHDYSFAPNTAFDFATIPDNEAPPRPGAYTLDLTATAGNRVWHWKRDFTVKRAEINAMKTKLGNQDRIPWWLIAIALLLLLLIILLLILLLRRKKKDDDDEEGAI